MNRSEHGNFLILCQFTNSTAIFFHCIHLPHVSCNHFVFQGLCVLDLVLPHYTNVQFVTNPHRLPHSIGPVVTIYYTSCTSKQFYVHRTRTSIASHRIAQQNIRQQFYCSMFIFLSPFSMMVLSFLAIQALYVSTMFPTFWFFFLFCSRCKVFVVFVA